MRYMSHAGERSGEATISLLRRAAAMGRHLTWPAVGAFAASVAATAARLLGPLAVRGGVDEGIARGDGGAVTRFALVFLVLLGVQYVFGRISRYAVAAVGERFLLDLRRRVFAHLVGMDLGFFGRQKTGVLVGRMTSDIESLQEFVGDGAVLALTNLLTVGGVAVAMVVLDWRLAAVSFAVVGVLVAVSAVFQRHAAVAYRRVREGIGRVLAGLQEGIAGVRVVQAFTHERRQAGTFGRVNEDYFAANMAAARAIAWYFPAVAFLRVVAIAAVLYVGGGRVVEGKLSFGTLVGFLLYLDWFFQPIVNLANVYNLLQSALAALGKLFQLLDTPPAVVEAPDAVDLPEPVAGEVALERVTFGYDPARPVLVDVELVVPPGQRLAVVGETGSGKSTLARLILRAYDPQRGIVRLDGHDLRSLTDRSRVAAVSLIPQDGFLFAGSLRRNLAYARPEADDVEIWNVLRAMGIDGWVRSLPEGLDTEVRERGSRFSAGERQLVALARAFLADPAVIVLDEATSNLDPETEVEVEGALRVLLHDRTAIVIAHRLRSAERADRVVVVDGGRIVADGTHESLVAEDPRYRRLVEIWKRGVL
ncbi:MAG TPA: ABC transporter ATP-binding protein [Actinobacteria bacterium]|nr:ABC transporter ATP-binding protein [Actinomycetota bacterium]